MHDGITVSAGSASLLAAVGDADCAEAHQACVVALQAASNQGISKIILETEALFSF